MTYLVGIVIAGAHAAEFRVRRAVETPDEVLDLLRAAADAAAEIRRTPETSFLLGAARVWRLAPDPRDDELLVDVGPNPESLRAAARAFRG